MESLILLTPIISFHYISYQQLAKTEIGVFWFFKHALVGKDKKKGLHSIHFSANINFYTQNQINLADI